jgi:hypothetical protein
MTAPDSQDEYDGPVYGVCPNGHGDENGIIAAEESYRADVFFNCPVCGAPLEYAEACKDNHPWCVGPEGPNQDAAWDGKCSTCSIAGVKLRAE